MNGQPNNRVEHAHGVRSTRNGEAPLLAAHAGRWAEKLLTMSFKAQWQRDKLRKKAKKGFRGYPVATIAYYGPDDARASKVVVAIVQSEGADADPMQKWYSESGDVRNDESILESIGTFLQSQSAKSVVAVDRIIGCPHEEGIDYPEGTKCPACPFWANRDRFSGDVIQ